MSSSENIGVQGDQKARFLVVGAGTWGTALAINLAKNGHDICLWDRDPSVLQTIQQERCNKKYIPEVPLPANIRVEMDLNQALETADHVLLVVPSHGFAEIIQQIKPKWSDAKSLIWATKGLDAKTGQFLHQVVEKELGDRPYALLSGPSFAHEVARGLPTAVTIASKDLAYAMNLAYTFSNNTFRVYVTQDVLGVQLGGVVKNVLAVAVGISDGLHLGANARAALITRGLAEMMRLGEALGAKRETLMGLAGCGDVILTCTDNQSRNRRFGLLLAEGMSEASALQKIGQVVEAVYNVEQLCQMANAEKIELPISEQVFRIVKQGLSPREAVTTLFARTPKSE